MLDARLGSKTVWHFVAKFIWILHLIRVFSLATGLMAVTIFFPLLCWYLCPQPSLSIIWYCKYQTADWPLPSPFSPCSVTAIFHGMKSSFTASFYCLAQQGVALICDGIAAILSCAWRMNVIYLNKKHDHVFVFLRIFGCSMLWLKEMQHLSFC